VGAAERSFTAIACTLVHRMVLVMSEMVQPRDRSFTGLDRPCINGPIAMAPVLCCTACMHMAPRGQYIVIIAEMFRRGTAIQWRVQGHGTLHKPISPMGEPHGGYVKLEVVYIAEAVR
jgi:hypothetical protein